RFLLRRRILFVLAPCCAQMRLTFADRFGAGRVRAWTSAPGGTKRGSEAQARSASDGMRRVYHPVACAPGLLEQAPCVQVAAGVKSVLLIVKSHGHGLLRDGPPSWFSELQHD